MTKISKLGPKPFLGASISNVKPTSKKIDEIIDRLNSISETEGKLEPTTSTVTQGTSITTGVTINQPAGVITTVSSSLAAATATAFTVTNSYCTSSSIVLATIQAYSGTTFTNGIPVIVKVTPGSGSFAVQLANLHASNALSGTIKIGFTILS